MVLTLRINYINIMERLIELQLNLHYTHSYSTKKGLVEKKLKYGLNKFIADISGKSYRGKRPPNYFIHRCAKKALQDKARRDLSKQPILQPPFPKNLELVIYRGTEHAQDLDNVSSILLKFVLDVLKEEHIPDDSHKYIDDIHLSFAKLDRKNPRAELFITDKPNAINI